MHGLGCAHGDRKRLGDEGAEPLAAPDGSGYPCGLQGEAISLLARISTLADVYDALSLGRVYKPAWPRDKVLDFIRQERGGMFDPRIVDLFFANLDELEAIKARLSDPVRQPARDEAIAACAVSTDPAPVSGHPPTPE